MQARYEIAIVGAGMAGASLAAALGPGVSVVLLEGEDHPGYHTTGRSAAFWTESYGGPRVQPLTAASGPMLADLGMLAPRSALTIGKAGQQAQIDAFAEEYGGIGVEVELLDRDGIAARVPGLRAEWTCGVLEPSCCDIDVGGLHQHYLATAARNGVTVACQAMLREARREGGGWVITLSDGRELRCDVLVNAAGAWADPVAAMAGASPLGITPYRRTIAQLSVDPAVPEHLPLVLDIAEQFYFKPESGRLWLSPHDETPSLPCDAAPEEIDVAIAIDRLQNVVDWEVRKLEHRWAGLRSFAPDRLPVYGFDAKVPGFFWFAGQGGFGIQTAPAAAEVGAQLLLGTQGGAIDPTSYAPARFA